MSADNYRDSWAWIRYLTAHSDSSRKILREFQCLFPDVPSKTDQTYHDVDVGEAQPVKQHPYRLNPKKQECLREEVKYLLENDLIEPSKSNWRSRYILVPKTRFPTARFTKARSQTSRPRPFVGSVLVWESVSVIQPIVRKS